MPAATTMAQSVPGGFIENRGQWPERVAFAARSGAGTVWVCDDALVLEVRGADRRRFTCELAIAGASPSMTRVGVEPRPGRSRFFVGNESARWSPDVASYGGVTYEDLHPGLDVHVMATAGGAALRLQGTASAVERFGLRITGATLSLDDDHAFALQADEFALRGVMGRDVTPSSPRFLALGPNQLGIAPGSEDSAPVEVVFGLEWGTFLGGSEVEWASSVLVDDAGGIVVGGRTESFDFPTTLGAIDTTFGGGTGSFPVDAFVARFDAAGTLVYATYLGGSNNERVASMAFDDEGRLVVAGQTSSEDFPVTPDAYQATGAGSSDGFIVHLNATGDTLLYSTYLGGSEYETLYDMALAPPLRVYVAGQTSSLDYPLTPGALDTVVEGLFSDAFVSCLDLETKTLVASTYFGGSQQDAITGVALCPGGDVIVAGGGASPDLPVTPGAYDEVGTGSEAFVARLSPLLDDVLYATYFGDVGSDNARALAIHPTGDIVISGLTESLSLFPTGYDTTYNGGADVFVARFDPTLSTLVAGSYLGGSLLDYGHALAVDSAGFITVGGPTQSTNFVTTDGAFQPTDPDGSPAFVDFFAARFDPRLTQLVYSTYLGGSLSDGTIALNDVDLALDAQRSAVIVGISLSRDYAGITPDAPSMTLQGGGDVVVTRLSMVPTGVAKYGASSAGCQGPLAIEVTVMPRLGATDFVLTCTDAGPFNGQGLLLLGLAPLAIGAPAAGGVLWIDPTLPWLTFPVPAANELGYAELPLPIPDDVVLVGLTVYAQFFWKVSCGPGQYASSNALQITLQDAAMP